MGKMAKRQAICGFVRDFWSGQCVLSERLCKPCTQKMEDETLATEWIRSFSKYKNRSFFTVWLGAIFKGLVLLKRNEMSRANFHA